MAEILEVVLEGVLRSKVNQILMILLSNAGTIVDVQCSEDIQLSDEERISEQEIEAFLNLSDDACLSIKLSTLKIDGIAIPSVLLRLLKYNDQFDIDFNFNESDIENISTTALMTKLHSYTTKLGESYEVGHWFGGMEPASDEDTRYFTDNKFGPLT